MEPEQRVVDLDAAIDNSPVSAYQFAIISLCAATVVFDGFDTQTIGILAPSIASSLHFPVVRFGIVFSSGLFGWMVGALTMGPIADRFGRRWAIIGSIILFAIFTLLVTTATTLKQLIVLWFLNGLGLGGAIPNAVALATEFAPSRLEAKVAGWVITGMPTGAILGGVASTFLLPVAGWRSVLYIGCALPLLLAMLFTVWLPESARFLVTVRADLARVKRLMQKVTPGLNIASITHFHSKEARSQGVPLQDLFTEGRAIDTLLFWIAFFGNLLIIFFVVTWFPAMLHGAGFSVSTAIIATTLFSVGGALGSASEGYLMGAFGGRRATIIELALSAMLIAVIADDHSTAWFVWLLTGILGVAVEGAQAGLNALAAAYYPTSVRSTGLGWALGMGRMGSIIGPLLGGLMLSLHWSLKAILMAGMVPAVMAGLALAAIAVRRHPAAVAFVRGS